MRATPFFHSWRRRFTIQIKPQTYCHFMNNFIKAVATVFTIVSSLSAASAQSSISDRSSPIFTLWGKTYVGMAPTEVLRLYPDAEVPIDAKSTSDGNKELLRISSTEANGDSTEVGFFFKTGQLYSVLHFLLIHDDFTSLIPRYEKLREDLKINHPISRNIESIKIVREKRFQSLLSDEWVTKEGIRADITMFEPSQPGTVRIATSISGGGGAWSRLESYRRDIEEHQKFTRKIEAIKNKKDKEAKIYNKYLTSWIGKNISQLADKWGAPTGTTRLPNNEEIYVWEIKSGDRQCRTSIFIKTDGKITRWQWSGNDCKQID